MNTCSRQSRASRREFLQGLAGAIGCGGAAAIIPQFGLVGSALAAAKGTVTGYKALVCVYLDGGNDAWNMLVPYDQTRYNAYAAARGGVYDAAANPSGLALDRGLLATTQIIDATSSAEYALHPGIPGGAATNDDRGMLDLSAMYQQNRLALVPNVGTLTRPITKTEYNTNAPGTRPPQLYSHSDQQYQWHFGRAGSSSVGWGGTVGDAVRNQNFNQTLSPCISIAGDNRFEIGVQTFPYQLGSGGLNALNVGGTPSAGTAALARRTAIDAILAGSNTSPFATEYQAVMNRAQSVYDILNPALNSPEGMVSTVFPNETLANQLRMVARMIKVSRDTAFQLQHQRQIYFVRLGGFDLHDNLMSAGANGHAGLLQRVSEAMSLFYTALGEFGAQNEVTTFTMSEFARTLSSNGNGSDHAWGSVAMVMGGTQVLGGRLYGAYPELLLNGPISFSSGQLIPQIGVEQYAATLARWMGVTDPTTLATIFPNLGQFASSDLGFMAA